MVFNSQYSSRIAQCTILYLLVRQIQCLAIVTTTPQYTHGGGAGIAGEMCHVGFYLFIVPAAPRWCRVFVFEYKQCGLI